MDDDHRRQSAAVISIEMVKEIHFPHSLGLLYSAFTYYTGFKVNSGEYKVMGLAPYGEPRYVALILDNLIDLKPDGSFRLNQEYFDYCTGLTHDERASLTNCSAGRRAIRSQLLDAARHGPRRLNAEGDRGGHAAADAQPGARKPASASSVWPAASRSIASPTARCCATAVSTNIWMQPAAGDAGGAVGAALSAYHTSSADRAGSAIVHRRNAGRLSRPRL